MKTILLAILLSLLCVAHASTAPAGSFGGWKEIRSKATGFFRTERIGGRWWLITPDGYGYYAVSTDHGKWEVHWCQAVGYSP